MRWFLLLKWTTFIISSILVIFGLFLATAVWLTHKNDFLANLVKPNGNGVYIVIITLALLIVTGVVGWTGLHRQSRSVLGSFTVLLLFTTATGTIGGIWTFVSASKTETMSMDRLRNIVLYDYGRDSSKTAILDVVQQSFQCCGSENYASWASSKYSGTELNESSNNSSVNIMFTVPQSCCIDPLSDTCQQKRKITTDQYVDAFIHTQGCISKVQASFTPFGKYSLLASILIGFIELLGVFASTLLCRTLERMENAVP